jgi:hypothetical protein
MGELLDGRPVTASVPPATPRTLASWIEVPEPGREAEAIGAFVARSIAAPTERARGISGGFLDDAEAVALRGRGLPVGTETARIVTGDAVRHIWNGHGPSAPRPDGVPPILEPDIAQWRALIAAAIETRVVAGNERAGQAQRPALAHMARDSQGNLVVVEEVRMGIGALALSTMYRVPPGMGRLDQVPGMRARIARAEASPPRPDADRRGGRPEQTSGTVGSLPHELPDPRGRFNAYTPAGRAVMVEPRVVDLSRLVPSHDPEGRLNPAYPHAEGVQPRDRSAAPSAEQVRRIVAGFQPARLLPAVEAGAGAPIVNPHDLVVESGNGRVMALMRVFRDPELAHLRDAYLDALARAGHDVEGIAEPVVVSARITPLSPTERIAFVREANGRLAAAETLAEAARRDADAAAGLLGLWRGGDIGSAANREFLRGFVARLPPEDLPGLLAKDGTALPALVQRVERALLQAAYGDALGPVLDRLIAGQVEGFRAISGALRNVAGDWASLRALRLSVTEPASDLRLPSPSARANRLLGFNAAGEPVPAVPNIGSMVVTPFAETLLDDASAAAARVTLGTEVAGDVNRPGFAGGCLV